MTTPRPTRAEVELLSKGNPPLTRDRVVQWANTWRLSGGDLARALIAADDALREIATSDNIHIQYLRNVARQALLEQDSSQEATT